MTIDSSNPLLDPAAGRRDFLRTAGLAAAGVGALSLFETPAMAAVAAQRHSRQSRAPPQPI